MIITAEDLYGAQVAIGIELMDGRRLTVFGVYRSGLIRPDPTSIQADNFPAFDVTRPYEQYRPAHYEHRVIVDMTLKLEKVTTGTTPPDAEP
jgi:hypothetical protein